MMIVSHVCSPLDGLGRYDIFGTANFFNFAALTQSVDLVTRTGLDRIYAHNLELARHLIDGIDPSLFEVLDRGATSQLSNIVFLRPINSSLNAAADHLAGLGIDVASRRGMLRFSPHFYNIGEDIDRALVALNTR